MASACVNNVGVSPEDFRDCAPAYGWLSPRVSFSSGYTDAEKKPESAPHASKDAGDFEFRLDDPVTMLPADELFSDGKFVPLQLKATATAAMVSPEEGVRSPEVRRSIRGTEAVSLSADPHLFSPKAPRCPSKWGEILGLKKLYRNNKATSTSTSTSPSASSSNTGKSTRNFLHRSSKSTPASDAFLNPSLSKDSECESLSFFSRLSLPSSSSGHDHDDLPRLSLDADMKPSNSHISQSRCSSGPIHQRVRMVKTRMVPASVDENPKPLIDHPSAPTTTVARGFSADSPRLSSSGKIVFQGLERSTSSPSSFNGGPRYKHRGVERSYSANVRVAPVLNVPVCSLRGSSKSSVFGLFSSQSQKKEGSSGSGGGNTKAHHHHHRTTRTRRESS